MKQVTLRFGHRVWNLNPGDLRPITLLSSILNIGSEQKSQTSEQNETTRERNETVFCVWWSGGAVNDKDGSNDGGMVS